MSGSVGKLTIAMRASFGRSGKGGGDAFGGFMISAHWCWLFKASAGCSPATGV